MLKSLEGARQEKLIGAPLEARVVLRAGGETYSLLQEYLPDLPALFIVSQVALEKGGEAAPAAAIERASGNKCERCWKYLPEVGSDGEFPALCAGCVEAVREILRANGG